MKTQIAPLGEDGAMEREKRRWWAVLEEDVRLVTGHSCRPNNPKSWWCPEIGYSLTEKYHLFETEREAVNALIGELTRKINAAQNNIESLQLRLKNLQ